MEIRTEVTLPYPRERVFTVYRDRLEELLPYLPNLRGLSIEKREDRGDELYQVNHWKGGGEIPSVARSFLRESMLSWTDHATWSKARWRCDWRTEVHAFPGALESSGASTFLETPGAVGGDPQTPGGGCRIEFRGPLVCDASKVPGVPKLLARSINGTVEKLFVTKIEENLLAVGQGIGKLLAREA
jgi:hypothetical protein